MPGFTYVIIPFFQRDSGILRRALDSIAAQRDTPDIRVLVIDDASPVSPHPDIEASNLGRHRVEVISQANAGPAAARNRALDHVPDDAEFVAFLDSDDQWTATHLSNARAALGDDLDFYFSNFREPESAHDQFGQHRRLNMSEHSPVGRGSNCYRFGGDMIVQTIFANVIETSTVVYRWSSLRQLRFRSDFRFAYEDHLFWIAAAQMCRGFAFSMDAECQYGRGVNIWRATGLGSERMLPRLLNTRQYCLEIRRLHVKTGSQAQLIDTKIAEVRETVIADVLHRVRRRMPLNWQGLGRYARSDPTAVICALPIAVRIAMRKAVAKPSTQTS